MKWFDNFMARCVRRAYNNESQAYDEPTPAITGYRGPKIASSGRHTTDSLRTRGMSFTIHSGSGGHVLEYNSYNDTTDRYENTLHLIPNNEDLGTSIGHAITLEMLRK